jgi:transketolase
VVRDGDDLTFIASGVMLSRCIKAAEILAKKGTSVRILNMHTIKPLDNSLVEKAAKETGALITAEEHSIMGGLGSAVAEFLSEKYPVPIKRIGIKDVFTETALTYEELLDSYGMSVNDIIQTTKMVMEELKK